MKKVGIIGCGNIAQVHAWVLQNLDGAELVAVCDVDAKRAEDLAEKYTGSKAKVYTDYRLLKSADVDVIHICTPHYLHAPMAIEMLRAGKLVFMEKPCAISRQQFESLKETAEKHPGKLGFCFQNRYNGTTLSIDRMIADGEIGAVKGARAFVTWRRDKDYYRDSAWKGNWATEGGGALINQSIHTLDLLLRYLGKPNEVNATIANHHLKDVVEVEDTVEAMLTFEDGKRACFYASTGYATDAPVILEIEGEKGRITLNGSDMIIRTEEDGVRLCSYEHSNGIGKGYWGCGHLACIRDFYRCLEQEVPYQGDISGVENVFDVTMRIYETAKGE